MRVRHVPVGSPGFYPPDEVIPAPTSRNRAAVLLLMDYADCPYWTVGSANISGFAGQSVRILIEAADASAASLVEAGVDNVTITQN